MITELVDYLNNNLLIAHYCGFDISLPLPSYWTFDRFLKNFNHSTLSDIIKPQVISLVDQGIIDSSFIGLDSTPVSSNTSHNNPKSFLSGLPIYELTTTAEVTDSSVALDILADTHAFLPVTEYTFLADKGYDVKNIYNQVKELYNGECIIPLNKRNTKNPKLLPQGNPICDAGLAMWKDGKFYDRGRTRQKFCCPLKNSKDTNCPCLP